MVEVPAPVSEIATTSNPQIGGKDEAAAAGQEDAERMAAGFGAALDCTREAVGATPNTTKDQP